MCQFLSSEIARLVLGYLEDTKCHKAYHTFLYESPDLEECRKIASSGVKYRRGKETLLSILQDYCDLTSNANATSLSAETISSAPTPERAQDADSVFKTPDKNNYRSLRRHVIRQRNLSRQFLLSPTSHISDLDKSPSHTLQEKRCSSVQTVTLESQPSAVGTETVSQPRSAGSTSHSALSSKESHSVESVISNSTKQFFFDGENRTGTIKAVYVHSPVRKDIFGHKSISVTSKRINLSPANKSKGKVLPHDSSNYSCRSLGDRTISIAEKRIHMQQDNPTTEKTPVKDNSDSAATDANCDEVDTCVKESHPVHMQNCEQIIGSELPHINNTSSPIHASNESLSVCEITRVQTLGTFSMTPGHCTPKVAGVTTTSIVSSTIANKNIMIPRIQITSTPEYGAKTPVYTTCPGSVNSPRYLLSDERLSLAPPLTPLKEMYNIRYDDGKSPKRKSIIPRRRIMSEHFSPVPKQNPLIEIINFNNLTADEGADPLASLEDWCNVSLLAERLADTINKVKSLEQQSDLTVANPSNAASDNDSTSQGNSDKLIHEVIKHSDVALEELMVSLSDKLEHSRDHGSASNSIPNNLLLSPINFASYEQSEDTQKSDALADNIECESKNVCDEQVQVREQNPISQNDNSQVPLIVQTSVTETSTTETEAVEASVIDTQAVEASVVEMQTVEVSAAEAVVETPVVETREIVSQDTSQITTLENSKRITGKTIANGQCETADSTASSVNAKASISDIPYATPEDTIVNKNNTDPIKNELNTPPKPNEETSPELIDLTSDNANVCSASKVSRSRRRARKIPQPRRRQARAKKPVVKQTDILNQAVMETINCEPLSAKKISVVPNEITSVVQRSNTVLGTGSVPQPLNSVSGTGSVVQPLNTVLQNTQPLNTVLGNAQPLNTVLGNAQPLNTALGNTQPLNTVVGTSDIAQNNGTTFMYTVPSASSNLSGIQNTPQTYIIWYPPNALPTGGNVVPAPVTIPPVKQSAPVVTNNNLNSTNSSTPHPVGTTSLQTKSNSNHICTVRKNLFDPPMQNTSLSLLAKAARDELNKKNAQTPKIQNVPSNGIQNDEDSISNVPVLSIPSPCPSNTDYGKISMLVHMPSGNSQSPRTFLVSQPNTPLTNNSQDAASQPNCQQRAGQVCIVAMDNSNSLTAPKKDLSANAKPTPIKVNTIQGNSPFSFLTLSPGHLQGLQQSYSSGSKLPVILPKVPGLDLPNNDQRLFRKRKNQTKADRNEPKLKRGRPAIPARKNKKGLFSSPENETETCSENKSICLESPVNEDSRSARDLFAEILGCDRKELQTPRTDVQSQPLKSLISSARKIVGCNNRTRKSHVRALDFSPQAMEPKSISPMTKQTPPKSKEKRFSSRSIRYKNRTSAKSKKKTEKPNNMPRTRSSISRSCDLTDVVNSEDNILDHSDDTMTDSHAVEEDLPKSGQKCPTPKNLPHNRSNEWNRILIEDSPVQRTRVHDTNSPAKENTVLNTLVKPKPKGSTSLSPIGSFRKVPASRKLSTSSEGSDAEDLNKSISASSEVVAAVSGENEEIHAHSISDAVNCETDGLKESFVSSTVNNEDHEVNNDALEDCNNGQEVINDALEDCNNDQEVINDNQKVNHEYINDPDVNDHEDINDQDVNDHEDINDQDVNDHEDINDQDVNDHEDINDHDDINDQEVINDDHEDINEDQEDSSTEVDAQNEVISPAISTDNAFITEPVNVVQDVTKCNAAIRGYPETRKPKVKDNPNLPVGVKVPRLWRKKDITSYSSSITSQILNKTRKRKTSPTKVLPMPPGKASAIRSLNILSSVALKQNVVQKKKKLTEEPATEKSPLNGYRYDTGAKQTVNTYLSNDCDNLRFVASKNEELGSATLSYEAAKTNEITSALSSILNEQQCERRTGGDSNSAYMNVEGEVVIGCESRSSSSDLRFQNKKSQRMEKPPSENTMEIEQAVTSIVPKPINEDGENELENVKAFLRQRLSNDSVGNKFISKPQTPVDIYDESAILLTPGKNLRETTISEHCSSRMARSHSESINEIERAVTSIVPNAAKEDGENELLKVKAFLSEQIRSDFLENNPTSEVPNASYNERLVHSTPEKALANVTTDQNVNARKSSVKSCPTGIGIARKDIRLCTSESNETQKESSYDTDLSFEAAETLASMNEQSNVSFDGGSSHLVTPGKDLMKSPSPKNSKSGDSILKTMSVDFLLGLVHAED